MIEDYILFLDDERDPSDSIKDAVVVRTFREGCELIYEAGMPRTVHLDHDLGEERTGYDFVKFLVGYCCQNGIDPYDINFNVHSQNPIGKRNMEVYWSDFCTNQEEWRANWVSPVVTS